MVATLGMAPGGVMAQSVSDRLDARISQPDLVAPERESQTQPRARVAAPLAAVVETAAQGVTIGAIRVEGLSQFAQADFSAAIAPWLGQRLSTADMARVATAVADVARGRGYIFARATIPAQTLERGILTVRLDEGRIDTIRIDGRERAGAAAIFAPLADGRPVTRTALERRISIAGDIPGVSIGEIKLRREGDRNILIVPVTQDRVWGRVSIDNRGTRLIGPVRMRLEVNAASLAADRDLLTVEGAVTALQPREFALVSSRYTVQPGGTGLQLSLSGYYARTAASGVFRALDIRGTNYEIAAEASVPLKRGRATGLWADGGFAVRRALQDAAGLNIREDRVSIATFTLRGYAPLGGGIFRASGEVGLGLGAFHATARGDPLSSNIRGSGRFITYQGDALWLKPLSNRWTLRATASAQLATRALLSGEQFSLGGQRLLRGYDYGEELGDEGAAGSLEIAYGVPHMPQPLRKLEIYGYVDGGRVRDKGVAGHASLASAGAGLRVEFKRSLSVALEAAKPLTGPRFDSGDKSPRLSFVLSALF